MTRPGSPPTAPPQPRPSLSSTPGRKFSTTMSASFASAFTMATPSGCLRFTVTDFLLRACRYHHSEGALVELAPFAQRVAAVGRLDLDHLGAELGHDAGGERTGNERAELEGLSGRRAASAIHSWGNQRKGSGAHHLVCGPALRLVERGIGAGKERVEGFAGSRRGDAEARRDRQAIGVRRRSSRAGARRRGRPAGSWCRAAPARTPRRRNAPAPAGHARCHAGCRPRHQHRIAARVAVLVVDLLEMVDVDHHQRQRFASSDAPRRSGAASRPSGDGGCAARSGRHAAPFP